MTSFSVLDGAMLVGGAEELYVYNVTDGRLIYSDTTPITDWWNYNNLFMSLLVGDNCLASLLRAVILKLLHSRLFKEVTNVRAVIKPTYLSYSNGTLYM
jgi:hypothetical protein